MNKTDLHRHLTEIVLAAESFFALEGNDPTSKQVDQALDKLHNAVMSYRIEENKQVTLPYEQTENKLL